MEKVQVGTPIQVGAYIVENADHITGGTGKTLTVEISKAGMPFQVAEATVTEVGYGWYNVDLTAVDTNSLGYLKIHITAPNCDPVDFELLVVSEFVSTTNPFTGQVSAYLTIDEGDAFFSTEMEHEAWDLATNDAKLRAIGSATRLIDRLNYLGEKADADQALEFPRNDDTSIPDDIKTACAYICYALLDGVDIEREAQNLTQSNVNFAGARSQYNRDFILEAYLHNIPSVKAWSYLKPYLQSKVEVVLSRIN